MQPANVFSIFLRKKGKTAQKATYKLCAHGIEIAGAEVSWLMLLLANYRYSWEAKRN